MPGTPLMLSIVSPISASTSTTWSGATPNFSFTPVGVVPGAFVARVEDADAVADELKEVLVARDDRDVEAGRRRLHRQRPDHIVGFVALGGEDRHAERLARGVHHRNLLRELVRHRRAVRLVVGDEIVAEGAARQIERRGDELRLVLVEQLAEHRDEDVDGVGRRALRVAQQSAFRRADRRVIRAVHLRAAVDEIEHKFLLYHWRSCGFCGRAMSNAEAAEIAEQIALRALRSVRAVRRACGGASALPAVRVRGRDLPLARRHGDGLRQQLARGAERAARHVVRRRARPRASTPPPVRAYFSTPGDARDARQPVAPQQPPLRPRAARRRRHHAGWARPRRSPGRRTSFTRDGDLFIYQQTVGASAGKDAGNAGWNGREIVAFRLHLPSKIRYHNTRRDVGRGNILVWEQPLADRLRGVPLDARRAHGPAVDSLPHALAVRRDVRRRRGRVRRRDLVGDAAGEDRIG